MSKTNPVSPAYKMAIWTLENIFSGLDRHPYTATQFADLFAAVGCVDEAAARALLGYAPRSTPPPVNALGQPIRPLSPANRRRAAAYAPFLKPLASKGVPL